ncbi:inositol monophosphatase family protein [Parabacteroides chinchillae]|uniref:Inositol-1-monophosphatase n=1 Tax=Parabacteroides chinchillae TaxID=871327 RepID=A0A8G2F3G0_9BACT|nr:inositol monophosphatase family protein [Parabacteroides chinchillae]SEG10451.1 myo-inositol-1(or 4)-monophosphatase [Parabacteroides chinchillae]
MADMESLCQKVQVIAREMGSFLKKERETFDFDKVEEKSAHNYVSYVDKQSERMLVDKLSALLPEAGFLAEEGTGSMNDSGYYWVIDPLDGTSNYIHDMAPYCVSIALCDKTGVLLGVVYEVHRDECFYATADSAAYLNGKEIHVSKVSALTDAFIALGFPYNSDAYRPVAYRLIKNLYGFAGGTRLLGSAAAELCYVAAGRFDARIEAYLGSWDVAAGSLIVQQAGGKVTDFNNGNNWFSGEQVVASNGSLHDTILALL